MANNVIIRPSVREQYQKFMARGRVLFFTAPCGFGLPTSRGRFYADFVAELVDGRVALLEFKGAHLDNAYETEKRQVGELWAQASAGRAVFGWLTIDGLAAQLNAVLGS